MAGVFIPSSTLKIWGWIIFLCSLGLITWGLLPYRRLSRLQLNPNELTLANNNVLSFYSKGDKILSFPFECVAKINYIEHPQRYGMAVWLKSFPLAPITYYETNGMEKMKKDAQQMHADLFFPYFNRRAYEELLDWQQEER